MLTAQRRGWSEPLPWRTLFVLWLAFFNHCQSLAAEFLLKLVDDVCDEIVESPADAVAHLLHARRSALGSENTQIGHFGYPPKE